MLGTFSPSCRLPVRAQLEFQVMILKHLFWIFSSLFMLGLGSWVKWYPVSNMGRIIMRWKVYRPLLGHLGWSGVLVFRSCVGPCPLFGPCHVSVKCYAEQGGLICCLDLAVSDVYR